MTETRRNLPEIGADHRATPAEIQEVLMDEGYSAGERKTWLKSVLTELTRGRPDLAPAERDRLIGEIKASLGEGGSGPPIADDLL